MVIIVGTVAHTELRIKGDIMKRRAGQSIIVSFLVMAALAGCGSSSDNNSASGPTALVGSIQLSAVEKSTGTFNAQDYMEGAVSYRFNDTDSDAQTSVTADGTQFTSPELNMTISGAAIDYVAGNVDATKTYVFGVSGFDSGGYSLELNASFEITDTVDDAATTLQDIDVPSQVGLLASGITVSATATDPDGMQSVAVSISNGSSFTETRYAYPDADPGRIDVNETFPNGGDGNYTVTFTALGIVGGEGNRSYAVAERPVNVSLINDINGTLNALDLAGILDNLSTILHDLNGTLTGADISVLLGDINLSLHESNITISEEAVTALLDDINATLSDVNGTLGGTVIDTLIEDINSTLSDIGGTLLGLL